MPFTTYSKAPAGGTGGDVDSFYYPEDIAILMQQPEARAVVFYNAVVGPQNLQCKAVIAVKFKTDGSTELLDGSDNLVGLPCPPYSKRGGVFLPDPEI